MDVNSYTTWRNVAIAVIAIVFIVIKLSPSNEESNSASTTDSTSSSVTSPTFGVGKWEGQENSEWDSNWSYTYELTLYNDGTAECIVTNHGPSGDDKEYAIGHWRKKSASFADRKYFWTEVKTSAGRRAHLFYVDNVGNAYHPFGRDVWQAIRDDKPAFTFRKISTDYNLRDYTDIE